MTKNKPIKVLWRDAYFYENGNIRGSISKMTTWGNLYKEEKEYIIVSSPVTINIISKERHPRNINPKYYYIPKGMVISIKEITKEQMDKEKNEKILNLH